METKQIPDWAINHFKAKLPDANKCEDKNFIFTLPPEEPSAIFRQPNISHTIEAPKSIVFEKMQRPNPFDGKGEFEWQFKFYGVLN